MHVYPPAPKGATRRLSVLAGVVALAVAAVVLTVSEAPAAAQQAQAVKVSTPFVIAGGPGVQANPSMAGNLLVYSDCSSGKCNIRGVNLPTKQAFTISQVNWDEDQPATDGVRAVWRDARAITDTAQLTYISNTNIVGASLADKKEFTVTSAPRQQAYPSISGNIVVWTDYRDAKGAEDKEAGDIYMYDLASGKESLVSRAKSAQVRPVTNGKVIIWQDYRNESDPNGFNSDIYGYDIAAGQEFVVSNAPDQQSEPAISGNTVVWSDFRKGEDYNADLYGYDLSTKKEFVISAAPGSQMEPAISGNIVVWKDFRNDARGSNSDIYGYDLATKQEFPVFVGPGAQGNPKVAGNTIVWEDATKGDGDTELMAATLPTAPLPPPTPLPGAGSQTFPETGKTAGGLFLDYWQKHGGLAQQGYPISEVIGEVSDLDGKPYTVQYFERAVFEYHPEEQPPYNVLLSQLGTFRYKGKYPRGAPNQQANTTLGSQLFPETGKHVGGLFLDYWQKHGGLAQQGYPISEEFTEVSDLDGKPYKVQYFERAVFELHPEKQPPYNVLLSQLGLFRYNSKYVGK